ncbi:hypothetical protein N9564_01925 [Amylibacter sp.]|jgi:thymidylate kinase|nr:hypothetical protein [Amylibacter sp.]
MIVSISGLDGAGKSTQIEMLCKRLIEDGVVTKIIWARGGYTPFFESLKKIVRLIGRNKVAPPGPSLKRKEQLAKPLVQKVWLIIAIFDLFLIWGVYARFLNLLGVAVIFDRYIDDTLLDFRRNFPKSDIENTVYWSFLRSTVPKPDSAFLLWIPVHVSEERSRLKSEPFPDTRETLIWRLKSYRDNTIFPKAKYKLLDGRLSLKDISDEIYLSIFRNSERNN